MSAWFERWTGLYLQDPLFLLLLLALPGIWAWRRRRGAPALLFGPFRFLGGKDQPPLPFRLRARLHWLPAALQALAAALLCVALARPVQRSLLPQQSLGIDIVMCLDTSSSMAANDLDPQRTRLQVAKAAAAQFVSGRPDDRIGLCTFARYADVRCPPTLDHGALLRMLAEVGQVQGDGPEDATGIGMAVARAAQVLQRSVARSKVVILLTDGEENVATDDAADEIAPRHAAQLCRQLGVRVYSIAVGVGKPDGSGGLQPLDTRDIDELASRTGGHGYTARDAAALSSVYAAIDALEKVALPTPRYAVEERFPWFLLAAAAAWLLGRLLRATWLSVLP